ncbi:Lrp/AsnC family transcriptional regulator [Candidatus Bathyarchaeota archaeon]|nr:Lrp/AsnC family transcriptional regulator [Candidatus Bathyarchaeota archaeon]
MLSNLLACQMGLGFGEVTLISWLAILLRKTSVMGLKETALRLIFELMKDSRRSDRTLAKALHVSQPTVSRMLTRLRKEGIIKEYTMIPDFTKLGFTLLAFTLVKLGANLSAEAIAEARTRAKQDLERRKDIMMLERGIGMGFDILILSVQRLLRVFGSEKVAAGILGLVRHSKLPSEPAG